MAKIISIKCPSCGANLELEDNKTRTKCQYCNTNIMIEKDLNDEITANILQTSKVVSKIFPIVFSFIILIFITTSIYMIFFSQRFFNHKSDFDKTSFNHAFTYANGTQTGLFVTETLDNVIDSNKKNNDHQIYVIYNNDKKTNNTAKIVSIKNELGIYDKYEVLIDYDSKGYINLITIEKK